MKVAIVGLAQDCRTGVPWDDQTWEKWGLAWDPEMWCRYDRTFEPHDWADLETIFKPMTPYVERLKDCSRLYMAEAYPEVPNATRLPFEELSAMGDEYFCSSVAYMLALAIHEGAEEIGLWGVKMEAHDEWGYQRPNCEYWIGFARARGIKVYIHEESPLCKFKGPAGSSYLGRYGRTR